MSHFTVMVIGAEPEKQLAPFSENIDVLAYKTGDVTDEEKLQFTEYYAKSEEDKKIPFETLYGMYGERWNSMSWAKDENGEWSEYSTRNPKSKWDWYSLGGRWSGMIKLKEGANGNAGRGSLVMQNEAGIDQAKKKDILNLDELRTFALLKDGEWYERGEMGWWGIVSNEKPEDEWESEFKKLLEGLSDETLISIYDCHI